MKIARFFIERPTIFWSFVAAILIAGVLAYMQMPKLEDPAVSAKRAMVVVPYPGASAHQVEIDVALLLEEEFRALPNVKKVITQCTPGAAMFTVEFQMTVLNKDLEQYFDLLRRKVNDAKIRLPQGCYDPVVVDDMMDVYGIFYSLTGDGYTYNELLDYAKYLRRQLLDVKGVKRIIIGGERSEVINITLTKEQLSRNGIMPTQIISALSNAGKTISSGYLQSGDQRIAVYVDDNIVDEQSISDLLISTLDGKQFRLGDIATVAREYAEPQRNGFFVDGKPAMAICIAMESSAIVPDVGKEVDRKLAEAIQNLPVGLQTDKIFFQPDKVSEAISSFMLNLIESVLIVILVLVFAMGWRSGVIIGFGLVLTVALSFPILLCFGTTLQRISLGAFIVAMGMLVDNSVVIMDGILIDKKRGLPASQYLFNIGRKTAMPLLGATVIAASTFLCVYLSPDTCGEYAGDLFLVLCVSLVASWALALVQVPFCANSWIPKKDKDSVKEEKELMDSKFHRLVRRAISALAEHKAITIVCSLLLLVISMWGMTQIKNLFFSDFAYKQFVIECFFPAETSSNTVRDQLLTMSQEVSAYPGVERVAISQGSAPAHYCLVRPMTNGGDCYGELVIDCPDYDTVLDILPKIRQQLRQNYPDAYVRAKKYNFSISTSHTVEVEFSGPDPAILRELSAQAEEIMRSSRFIDAYSVQNNWKSNGKSIVTAFNQQNALTSGITRGDIGNAIMAATDGMAVGLIHDHDRMVPINLQIRNADGSRITDINDMPVWSMMNVHMSNDQLASALQSGKSMSELQDRLFRSSRMSNIVDSITLTPNEDLVYRINGRRAIETECDPNPDYYKATPATAVADIKDAIEAIQLPDGYEMRWIGEGEVRDEAIGNLLKFVPITIFLILIILLLLFNSWRKVILILIIFPFVFCGISPAMLLTGKPLTFMSVIAFVGLMGMMVKNSIVLVDEIGRLQDEEGVSPYKAVIEASVSRVRPVMLASLTTIVGMLPLVADPMYDSLAVTIMGGLAVGTLITLILLPVFYMAFFKIKK